MMDYFDLHADTLTQIPQGESLLENGCNLDISRVGEFAGRFAQVFAIWKDSKAAGQPDFMELYGRAAALMAAQSGRIVWCRNASDMETAHGQGKGAAFLSVEDISIAENMEDTAGRLSELGVCFASLCWNYENEYACGAAFDQTKGLTQAGRDLAAGLVQNGIVLDISHLSDRGVEELFGLTDCPLIASHSDIRSVCDHPRNLRPEHVRELVQRKGLIGLNFYRDFVGEGGFLQLLRHADAVLEAGGEDALAVGSDFDGCKDRFAEGIRGVQTVPELYRAMERAGMDTKLLDKMFYENAACFVRRTLG